MDGGGPFALPAWGDPTNGVIDGLIYVAGGDGPRMEGSELSVYDPVEDAWASLPPMECGRNHSAGGVIAGRLHVVGGRPENASCHEAYDPGTRTWSRLADLPTPRSGAGGAVVGGWLFVMGGEFNPDDPDLVFGTVETYDPAEDSWHLGPNMLWPRHGVAAAAIGDTIFLPGGGRRTRAVSSNDALIVEREAVGELNP